MNRTVLYVEDDRLNAAMMLNALTRENGLEVLAATSGEQALELAQAQLPDLILLDIGLPGIDGFEVLQRLRNDPRSSHIPVIALTGYDMNDEFMKESGFASYLSKPILVQELIRIVHVILEGKSG